MEGPGVLYVAGGRGFLCCGRRSSDTAGEGLMEHELDPLSDDGVGLSRHIDSHAWALCAVPIGPKSSHRSSLLDSTGGPTLASTSNPLTRIA